MSSNNTQTPKVALKWNRPLLWVILNGLVAWCAWAGVVEGSIGAGRVVIFTAWLVALTGYAVVLAPEHIAKEVAQEGRSVPSWVAQTYDAAMIVLLVWHGWWWTGIAFMISMLIETSLYTPKTNDKTKTNEAN